MQELTDSELEVVERVFIDDVQLPHQGKCKFYHGPDVHVLPVVFLLKTQHKDVGLAG